MARLSLGQREMIDADLDIAVRDQRRGSRSGLLGALGRGGEAVVGDHALILGDPWHVRIAEQRDAVGLHRDALLDGPAQRRRRLMRQLRR